MDDRVLYDRIGTGYTATRRPDARIAAAIAGALGGARTVVNVGAGAGAYEPADREVIAIEPSAVMIAQRPAAAAQAIQAHAEALPLPDDAVDAAMAIISDHHWADRRAGLLELRRVARHRVVLVNSDPGRADAFWLTRDYLPAFRDLIRAPYEQPGYWERELAQLWGVVDVRVLPVPHDCADGFYQAYWRRPEAYLDPAVRDGISVFHRAPPAAVEAMTTRLAGDLRSGAWQERHRALLDLDAADVGLRLVVADLTAS